VKIDQTKFALCYTIVIVDSCSSANHVRIWEKDANVLHSSVEKGFLEMYVCFLQHFAGALQ
jgi:hypothetical protein